jgi:excisionase family DNA binding protein
MDMSRDQLAVYLKTKAAIPLFPEVADMLGLSRSEAYRACKKGRIKSYRFGRRVFVPTAWLSRTLDLDEGGEER